jgi:hypothetical protein
MKKMWIQQPEKEAFIFTLRSSAITDPVEELAIAPDWVATVRQMGNTNTTEITTKDGEKFIVMGTFSEIVAEVWP